MPREELLARTDSAELSEWMAYYQINPFGEWRADLRNGITAAVMANAHRGRGARAFKAKDFIPQFDRPEKKTPAQLGAIFDLFARSHNARLGETKK